MAERMRVKKGDIVKMKVSLYYDRFLEYLTTKEKLDKRMFLYKPLSVYLRKGTLMTALGTGYVENIEFKGAGREMGLHDEWIYKQIVTKK